MPAPVSRRPPSRPPVPPWMTPIAERLSRTITTLVVSLSVVFLFYVFVKDARVFYEEILVLGPGFFMGRLWQPVTALLVYLDPISFLFGLVGIWFAAATIERELGRRRLLILLFVPALAANLAMAGVSRALGRIEILPPGLGLGILGLFVAIGRLWGRQPARVFGSLVMESRTLAALFVAFALVTDLSRGAWAVVVGDLVAVGLAFVLGGRKGDRWRTVIEDLTGGGRPPGRRKFKVMDGGRARGADGSGYLN